MIGRLAPTNPTMAGLHAALGGVGRIRRRNARRPRSGQPQTANAVDRLGNIIRSGGASPITIAPMGPRATSPLAALLMGSGVNAAQPAQPYATGLGAAFAQ
jgi:hypothetical protein